MASGYPCSREAPSASRADDIPWRLVWQVGLPDDQHLHEVQICPEDKQRQQQPPKVAQRGIRPVAHR
jgi:hypothetical protein